MEAPRVAGFAEDADRPGQLRLEGQVIDEQEQPVGGAVVSLGSSPPREVTTEADGSFAFDALLARHYRVEARAEAAAATPIEVRLDATTEPVILRLRPASGVEITVVDPDRRPLVGIDVELRGLGARGARTDADGKVSFPGVTPGLYLAVASAEKLATATVPIEVNLSAGAPTTETIVLTAGAAISGRVVDASGRGVAGARVVTMVAGALLDPSDPRAPAVATDDKGAFVLPPVAAGTVRLSVTHPGHAPALSDYLTLDGRSDVTGVEVRLGGGARITGRVVDSDHKPVDGATIRVVARGFIPGGRRQTSADHTGRFELTGLPREHVTILALSDDATSEAVALDLAVGPPPGELELVLAVASRIEGIVVGRDGQPLPEAPVLALPLGDANDGRASIRGPVAAVSDGGGRFVLRALRPGNYAVAAAPPGDKPLPTTKSTPIAAGARDVKIVVDDGAEVRGRVVLADGTAPSLFALSIGAAKPVHFGGGDGAFVLRRVPPGRYRLEVTGPGFIRTMVDPVEVSGGDDVDVGTIKVAAGRGISGRVVDSNGSPVAGATVVAGARVLGDGAHLKSTLIGGGLGARDTTTADDGSFALSGLDGRAVFIAAERDGVGRSAFTRLPASPDSARVDLVLIPSGSIEGTITRGGRPVPGAALAAALGELTGDGGAGAVVTSDAQGTFMFETVTPGDYTIYAVIPGDSGVAKDTATRKVTVKAGQRAKVELELGTADGIAVKVQVTHPGGAPVETAQVVVVAGKKGPDGKISGPGETYIGSVETGQPALINSVPAGEYVVCAVAVDRVDKPIDEAQLKKAVCKPVVIAAQPATQTVAVELRE